MNEQMIKWQIWYDCKNQRDKRLILFGALLLIFIIWNYLLMGSFEDKRAKQQQQKVVVEQEITGLNEQINRLNQEINHPQKTALAKEHAVMRQQLDDMNKKLAMRKDIAAIGAPELLSGIRQLLQEDKEISLINLETEQDSSNKETLNAAKSNVSHKYTLLLEFSANYFSTVAFLQRLEKMPWLLGWDKLDYEVTDYPLAKVALKIHILTP